MGFKLLVLNPAEQEGMEYINDWPDKLKETIPGIEVNLARSVGEAMEVIGEVDAAFGNIVPELFERADKLKWIACPQAGPKAGYYHQALLDSEVTVTNTREIYNDHISATSCHMSWPLPEDCTFISRVSCRGNGVLDTTLSTFQIPRLS